MRLVQSMSGLIHKSTCYSLRSVYKVVAPEIDASEAAAFLKVRKLTPCHACFPVVSA